MTIEYDGTPFRGWAAQPGRPTVEGALREALAATFASYDTLAVAGRTDSGVHALGQVGVGRRRGRARRPTRAAEALNTRLPDEISVVVRRGGGARLPRALLGACAHVPLPHLQPPLRRRRSR